MKPMDPSWLFEEIHRRWGSVTRHHEGFPESYPADLEETVTVGQGARLEIRPILPDDIEELRAGFAELSTETVYRRFHTHLSTLSDEACRYLTHVDYRDHLALVAMDPAAKEGVGVARYYHPEGSALAEAAVVVTDSWQRRGVGPVLLDRLVAAALSRDISGFEAYVQPDNRPLMKLLQQSGYEIRQELLEDVLRVELRFGTPPAAA